MMENIFIEQSFLYIENTFMKIETSRVSSISA